MMKGSEYNKLSKKPWLVLLQPLQRTRESRDDVAKQFKRHEFHGSIEASQLDDHKRLLTFSLSVTNLLVWVRLCLMIDVFPRTVCTIPWVGIVSFASFDNLFSQAGFLGDYLYVAVFLSFRGFSAWRSTFVANPYVR